MKEKSDSDFIGILIDPRIKAFNQIVFNVIIRAHSFPRATEFRA